MSRRNLTPALSVLLTLLVFAAVPVWAGSWAKSYGTAFNEGVGRVEPTADGGFIVAGTTYTGETNHWDGLVVKLDKLGTLQWSKTYGGTSNDGFAAVKPTWDGGFVAVGYSISYGTGDSRDLWIVKMSYDGTVLWERTYGGAYDDEAFAVVQCPDGNYAAAGYTSSIHGTGGDFDAFLLKVAYADGAPIWETTYGGDLDEAKADGREVTLDLDVLTDGNLVAVGSTDSWGADQHVLVLTVDSSSGVLILQRYYDQDYDEEATAVCATPDGGCLLTGFAYAGTEQNDDLFVMKLNSDLSIQYQQRYGGGGQDRGAGIQLTHEADGLGGYYAAVAGFNNSNAGGPDVWVLKLDGHLRAGTSYPGTWQWRYGGSSADSGTWIRETYDGGTIVCAGTASYGAGNDDAWVLKIPSDGVIEAECQNDTPGMLTCSLVLETPDGVTTSPTWTATPTDAPAALTLATATQCESCSADAYEPDDTCFATPSVLHGGESQVHNFCDDAADWITFNACAGESYTVSTSGTSVDTILEIVGPDCATVIGSDTDGGTASVSWTETAGGTYHIKVSPYGTFSGDYTVSLTGDTTPCPDATWSQFYSGPVAGDEYPRYGSPTADGGMLTVGFSADPVSWITDVWTLRLDRLGNIVWTKGYGGASNDVGTFVEQTSDGGHIIAGYTQSFSAGGDYDGWILKLDASGAIVWQKTYGGTGDDRLIGVRPMASGGYVAAGWTLSTGGLGADLWVLRLDGSGNVVWEKTYAGPLEPNYGDYIKVKATAEGGCAVAVTRNTSTDPDPIANPQYDFWVIKLDPWGGIQWQMSYGGTIDDYLLGFDQGVDGNYGATGHSNSFTGGVSFHVWTLRLNPFGQFVWQRTYGDTAGSESDLSFSVRGTSAGGFLLSGASSSYSGDSSYSLWLVKLDTSGGIVWENRYDASLEDLAFSAMETPDGGCAVTGYTEFFSPDTFSFDLWALHTGSDGSIPQPSCTVFTPTSADDDATAGTASMTVASASTPPWSSASPSVTTSSPSSIAGGFPPILGANNTAEDLDPCADTGVTVTWSAPTSWGTGGAGTRGFNVYRDTIPPGTPLLLNGALLADTTLSYVDETGDNGTTYRYFVEAVNGCALSTTTAGASAMDFAASAPVLANNSAADVHLCDDTGVEISWNAPSDWGDNGTGTRTFDVFRSDSPGTPIAAGLSSSTLSYLDTTGTNNTAYAYTVRASNGCTLSTTTSGASAMDFVASAPSGLANNSAADIHPCDDTGVRITWAAPSDWGDNGTGTRTFDVFRSDSPGTPLAAGLPSTQTSYDDTAGTNNTPYSYTVRATNGCALATTTSGASAMDFVASAPVLANNSAADAHACGDTGVTVSWTAPTPWGDNGNGTRTFDVFRSDNPGTPLAAGLPSSQLSYDDTTGTNGTTYAYTVRANNGCALSATTAGASAMDFVGTAPSGLANNTAADIHVCDDTGVQITWAAPSDWGDNGSGTRTFDVFRSDNPGTPLAAGLPSTQTSYDDTTGTNGTTYTYSVRANNGCTLTATTSGASAMDFVASAPSLANNTAADVHPCDDTGVRVTWTAPTEWGDNGTGTRTFDVFRSDNPGTPLTPGLPSTQTSYDDTTGTNGTTYTYTVRANNGCALTTTTSGASAMDFVASVPVLANNTAADAHTCDDTGVTVSWTAPSDWGDNGTGTRTFDIFRSDNAGTPLVAGLAASQTSYADTTGTNGTTYTYTVRANNGCALTTTTAGASAMDFVKSAPSSPNITSAADANTCQDTGVTVAWTAPSSWGDNGAGTRTYTILRDDVPLASGGCTGSLTEGTLTCTDNTGTNGTLYTYKVRANNGCALSTESTGVQAVDDNFTPTPTITGAATNVCPSLTVELSTETGMTAYQWYRNSGAISGANAATHTASLTGTYTVSYTGNGCSGTSSGHAVTISGAPSVYNNPTVTDNSVCAYDGIRIAFSSSPSSWNDGGFGGRSYTILRDGGVLASGLPYPDTQYLDVTAAPDTTYSYQVRYVNGCGLYGTTSSRTGKDANGTPAAPTISGDSRNYCPATYCDLATQPGMDAYQWYKNGSIIPGATTDTFRVTDLGFAAYTVQVWSATCSGTSSNKYVTIYNSAPSVSTNNTAEDASACAASGITVTWPQNPSNWNDGSGTRTYTVLRDGSPLAAGTGLAYGTTSFTDTTAVLGQTYTYKVRYSNACQLTTDTAGASATDVNNTPTPTISGDATNTCPSLTVTLSTATGKTGYQWYLGASPISGANSATYAAATSGTYFVSYVENGCTGTSGGHAVTLQGCAVQPVPDGRLSGTTMAGTKVSDDSLTVTYDVTTCPTAGATYNILYGNLADLGTATPVTGSVCGIAAGSATWGSVPSADTFWVIVARVGDKESSWGEAFDGSSYSPRSTTASGKCGAATIDTTSTCP